MTRKERVDVAADPEGRDREATWPTITYVRVRSSRVRVSDFRTGAIVELVREQLA